MCAAPGVMLLLGGGDRSLAAMGELLEFKTEAGELVLVEVDEPRGLVTRGGRPAVAVVEAGASLEQVLGRLGPTVRAIVAQLRATADWPDEVEVEFGVKLSADSNVIIARAGAEANFRIALKWARPPQGDAAGKAAGS